MSSNSIFISGTGGHHASVKELAVSCGFDVWRGASCNPPIEHRSDFPYANGWGLSRGVARRHQLFELEHKDYREAPPLLSPQAFVSSHAIIGLGVQVHPLAVVRTDAQIGRDVVVNSGSIIEHHAVVGNGTFIAPRAVLLGSCSVGERVLIGAGAVVLDGLVIGDDAVVGAGAVVVNSVEAGSVVYGVPAHSYSTSE